MDVLTLAASLAATCVGVGIAWGVLGNQIANIRRELEEAKRVKASTERVSGLEALILEKLSGMAEQIAGLRGEIHALRSERTNPGV